MARGARPTGRTRAAGAPTFAFGRNWLVDGKRVPGVDSGSGVFFLAAMRLGAASVHSFDVDLGSAACARALKRRRRPGDDRRSRSRGSVRDGIGWLRRLERLVSVPGGSGNHEFVFRTPDRGAAGGV